MIATATATAAAGAAATTTGTTPSATPVFPRKYPIVWGSGTQSDRDAWLASYNNGTAYTGAQLALLDKFNLVYPALDPFYYDLWESVRQRTPVLNAYGLAAVPPATGTAGGATAQYGGSPTIGGTIAPAPSTTVNPPPPSSLVAVPSVATVLPSTVVLAPPGPTPVLRMAPTLTVPVPSGTPAGLAPVVVPTTTPPPAPTIPPPAPSRPVLGVVPAPAASGSAAPPAPPVAGIGLPPWAIPVAVGALALAMVSRGR